MHSPQRVLSCYQWAYFVSSLGNRMTVFAASMELTLDVRAIPISSALALSFLFSNWQSIVFPLFGGKIGDRFKRSRVVLTAQVLLAGQSLLLSRFHTEVLALYTIGATSSITAALSQPAQDALVQDLTGERKLHQTLATNTALRYAAWAIVPMFSSLAVFQAHEARVLYLVDAASFVPLIAAAAYASIRLGDTPSQESALTIPPATLTEATNHLKADTDGKHLLAWCVVLVTAASGGFVYQRTLPLTYGNLQLYTWITSVSAVGGLAASGLVRKMKRPNVRWAHQGAVAALMLTAALGVVHWFPATLLFVFAETVAYMVFMLVATPKLNTVGPDRLRERVIGIVLAIKTSGEVASNMLLGLLIPLIGLQASLVLMGTGGLLALRFLSLKRLG